MMEIPLDEVVYFDVITSTPSTSAAVNADSTPTFAVYEEATDTDIGVGGNLTKRTSLTGNYRGSFTASAANGFEVGKWYSVICSATVGAVVGKCRALGFRCKAAENVAGFPAVDAAKLLGTTISTPATAGVLDVNLIAWKNSAPLNLSSSRPVVTVAVINTDVITASTIATDAITEIQAGLASAADLATVAGYLDTEINAIKTQTDKFVFTVANQVNCNVKYVNDVQLQGTGVATTDEWRPV